MAFGYYIYTVAEIMSMYYLFALRFVTQPLSALAVAALLCLALIPQHYSEAAALTSVSNTMSSQKIATSSSHTIRFTTPTGVSDNTDTIVITFPSDFNFTGKATSTLTLTHGPTTGLENVETIGAPTTDNWSAVFSGTASRTLTLTAPTDGAGVSPIAPGARVIVSYNASSSTNPTVAGPYAIGIYGAFGDTGTATVSILNDDQVAIDATVSQSITFSISDNSISFGTLNSGAARYASGTAAGEASEVEAHNIIVGTNASNGYTMTASGTTLRSGSDSITAIGASNSLSSVGTEQFGLRMNASGGNGAVAAPYSAAGFAFDSAAFPDTVATSTVASANTTYSVRYLANISANTEAGNYTSTLTYTAAANF